MNRPPEYLPPHQPHPPQAPRPQQPARPPHPQAPALPRFNVALLRLIARLIDFVIAFACAVAAGALVTGVAEVVFEGGYQEAGLGYSIPLVTVLVATGWVYEWAQLARWGRTVGKRVAGLRVVRAADGAPVTSGRAALRALCYSPGPYHVPSYVPVLAQLNVLWMLWDRPLAQCLHDKAAKTTVVVES